MVKLIVRNKNVKILGANKKIIRKLEKITSYMVGGCWFVESYKKGHWDGKEHLLKFSKKNGYRAPIGLLEDIVNKLEKMKVRYKITNKKKKKKKKTTLEWNPDIILRPYQNRAVSAIIDNKASRKLFAGSGLLNLPVRSGKTLIAAKITHSLQVKTLFIVNSKILMYQSQKVFQDALGIEVGVVGDSEWSEGLVTVAMIQTLYNAMGGMVDGPDGKRVRIPPQDRYLKLISNYDLVFFDECHQLVAKTYHLVMQQIDAPCRIGLSATILLSHKKENERGVIWLKACCGNIRYKISMSKLVKLGYLLQPIIELYIITQPNLIGYRWGIELKASAIAENPHRNGKIVEVAIDKVSQGLQVLIITNRLNQVEILAEYLDDEGMSFAIITGSTSTSERKEIVEDYTSGIYDILIGTVLGQGVDIPAIDCVINAEGGKDVKATIQKMRSLTPAKNRTKAYIVDFMDLTNPYFAEHSKERLKVYRSESGFIVKVI